MNNVRIFTSESVCEGHPDKVCDLIADSILDEALRHDPESRVACEACCTTGMVLVMGEFTTAKYIDIPFIARNVIKNIGYNKPEYGFDHHTVAVLTYINQQSEDIALGITGGGKKGKSMGAGDQGMMFGYATNETPSLMPLPISLSHALTARLANVRKSGQMDYLRPDGKAQVSVIYQDNKPIAVDSIVVSCQHNPDCSLQTLKDDVMENVILNVVDKNLLTSNTKFFINPTGRFVKGGPHGDSGLTGRKIIVDTYGGMCFHGGGSFSGKDPTKVDRSAAYYARYVCKNVVAAGLAQRCMLSVSYAIGQADPLMIAVDTFGTAKHSEQAIANAIKKVFDFRPYSIIKNLDLKKPIYALTTNYGHFGKEGLPYEKTDMVEALKSEI